MARLAVLALILALVGCSGRPPEVVYQPVEILVPVEVFRTPPEPLATAYTPDRLPRFIPPADPAAKVALSAEELTNLKTLLRTLVTRDEAWRVWATGESN